jgi:hypothetical protein
MSKNKESSASKKVNEEDEDEWSRIEREQGMGDDNDDEGSDEDHDSSDSDESEDDLKCEGAVGTTDEFTFEFNDMKEEYVEGVTFLLKSVVANPTTAYETACEIVKQELVGTAVANEGENDVFAFSTILLLQKVTSNPLEMILKKLRSLVDPTDAFASSVQGSSSSSSVKQTAAGATTATSNVEEYLNRGYGTRKDNTGLFLHRKVSNLPLQLISPLHRNIFDDLQWARSQSENGIKSSAATELTAEDLADLQAFKQLECLFLISTLSIEANSSLSAAVKKSGYVEIGPGDSSLMYDALEDEIYHKNSTCAFVFNCSEVSEKPLAVMMLHVDGFETAVKEISTLMDESASSSNMNT